MALHIIKFQERYTAKRGAEDWVLMGPKGEALERTKSWHRVKDLIPKDLSQMDDDDAEVIRNGLSYQAMQARWSVIEPKYKAWKAGREIPDDGTPLGAWSGCTSDQADYLRKLGLVTVEQVANMNEATISKIPFPDPRGFRAMAKAFVEAKPNEEVRQENAELKQRLAALEEAILQMNAEEAAADKAKPRTRSKAKQEPEEA